MAAKQYPPIALLSQAFDYKGGSLYWKWRPVQHFTDDRVWKMWNTRFADTEAGYPHFISRDNNYRWLVGLSGKQFYRSVLVWALHYKMWPTSDIDHEDHNPLNDHIENLRLATPSQNGANRTKPSNSSSGFKGVSWNKFSGKWQAQIMVNGKKINLGRFNTKEQAHEEYCKAALKYFGEFACF